MVSIAAAEDLATILDEDATAVFEVRCIAIFKLTFVLMEWRRARRLDARLGEVLWLDES